MLIAFSESTVSQPGNARSHSHTRNIFKRAVSASPDWQKMPGDTYSLNTFSESTVSQSRLAGNARTHSHPGHIFREHCQPVQFGRKCQKTLTVCAHFQRALSASPVCRKCQDTLTYWAHLHRALSASSVWQEMPGNTHSLDTFSESGSDSQKMPESTHILKTFSESTVRQSSLTENAKTHSPTGHIFRESTVSQFSLAGNARMHSHPGHIFRESTVSQFSLAGNARTHSHAVHIFIEHSQPVQFGRKCKDALTRWTHLHRALSVSSDWQEMWGTLTAWTHFQRALSVSPVWQEIPGHTHNLDTFLESTVSQSHWVENARTHSHPGHIFREHCQPVQFRRKCQDTLTFWTNF